MINNTKVHGTMETVQPLEVNVDTVYVRSNIVKVETTDFIGWEYDEIQYTKDEYIALIAQQSNLAADTLKSNPSLETIKSLYTMNQATKDDVYQYVKDGNITQADYLTVTGETCPELPLDVVKQNKINELNQKCNETIINGFYSDADGTKKLYDFELENQVNLSTKAYQLQIAKLAGQPINTISYYAKGETCHDYTAEQFSKLAQDGETWKISNIQKYKDILKPKVMACTTIEEVSAITWDGDTNATQQTI